MSFQHILLEKADGLATVTINRPKVMNALDHDTLVELAAAFDDVKQDASVRALILTGAGEKAFVAGADINELARMDPLGAKDLSHRGQRVFTRLEDLGKPSIAPCAPRRRRRGSGCPRCRSASSPATAARSASRGSRDPASRASGS
jgi:enoyl-CoA hydratase